MAQEIKGDLQGKGLRIAVVVSRFNQSITSKLLEGALEGLATHGVQDQNVTVIWVPGSFEIPLAAKRMASHSYIDAVVCLGAVVRHQTDHYRYIAEAAATGIAEVARETGKPVSFGVLTTDNEQQALERAGGKEGNKGYDAALTAIEMANLLRTIEG